MNELLTPNYNPGGLGDIYDSRDYKWEDIGSALPPFDWNTGFDIEKKLSSILKIPFNLQQYDNKDQNGSGSCGGQAVSYYGGIKEAVASGSFERRSAKFLYSQVWVPGGGSKMRDLFDISIKQGFAKESICSSYDNGLPPGEAFMERSSDVTQVARNDAKSAQGLSYFYVNLDVDSVAQAIANNDGVVILLNGQNNGTWRTAYPTVPTHKDWGHFMYAGKAFLSNGKKIIGAKQSWGLGIGDNGWQYFTEDWFTSQNITQVGALVWNNRSTPTFTHNFQTPIKLGDKGNEVIALQQALRQDGEFTYPVNTGFYGDVTRQAVLAFQNKYGIPADNLNGTLVGPKTRSKLNDLFNK